MRNKAISITTFFFLIAFAVFFQFCEDPPVVKYGTLKVIVKDNVNGNPVPGARTEFFTLGRTMTSNEKGEYFMNKLYPNNYHGITNCDSYIPDTSEFLIESGQDAVHELILIPDTPSIFIADKDIYLSKTYTSHSLVVKNLGNHILECSITKHTYWMQLSTDTLSISAGDSASVMVTVLITAIEDGEHFTKIDIESNSRYNGFIEIPIRVYKQPQTGTPYATFELTPYDGPLKQIFNVNASASTDNSTETEDLQVSWQWEEDDDFTEWTTVKTLYHQYTTDGNKTIKLLVKDKHGNIGASSRQVYVYPNMPPEAIFAVYPNAGFPVDTFHFDGTYSYDDNQGSDELLYRWKFDEDVQYTAWEHTSITSYHYHDFGFKQIIMEVKDVQGEISTTERQITIFEPYAPEVITLNANNITHKSAYVSADIRELGIGAGYLTAHGHVWSKTELMPGLNNCDGYTDIGQSEITGVYESWINNLEPSTFYFVRAYVSNIGKTAYGNVVGVRTTMPVPPTLVSTGPAQNIEATSVRLTGNLSSMGIGFTIVTYGHCWSTDNEEPTVANSFSDLGIPEEIGDFETTVTFLTPNTTYYVRTYAGTNLGEVLYGNIIAFTTYD